MTLVALFLLASLDGALCGCRTSMGRCPLIRTRNYYLTGVLRGVLAAQIVSAFSLICLLIVVAFSRNQHLLRADLEQSAARMLYVFVPYAALVLANLALRAIPSTDIRSATSVFFLGPLTALRTFIMIAGVLVGIWRAQLRETLFLGLLILVLMLSVEYALNSYCARLQERQIRSLA
jgi:L-asparagine transporter-like permease